MRLEFVLGIVMATAISAAPVTGAESTRTPAAVLQRLKNGNARYLTGISRHARIDVERRVETARKGQKPYATIVGCSDARVPTEVVFDQGFAEVFVIRVAGNVIDTAGLASVEYGAGYLGTPLVVVLGHSKCGAVDAAVSGAELAGSLPRLMDMIKPAVEKARHDNPELKGEMLLERAIEANVYHSMEELLRGSPVLRERVKSGRLKIVGAIRDLKSGRVRWLGELPNQAALLSG